MKNKKKNFLTPPRNIRGKAVVAILGILSLFSVGYSAWVVGDKGNKDIDVDVTVDDIIEVTHQLFSLNGSEGIKYYYTADGTGNGLEYNDVIGTKGTASFALSFDMETFKKYFSWDSITFQFTLSYADSITGLSLLNSSTEATLLTSKTTRTNNKTETSSYEKSTISNIPSDTSSVTHSYTFSNSNTETLTRLNFKISYVFTVSDSVAEAKTLSLLSENIFKISATATEGGDA